MIRRAVLVAWRWVLNGVLFCVAVWIACALVTIGLYTILACMLWAAFAQALRSWRNG